MKKILALVLSVLTILSCTACGAKEAEETKTNNTAPKISQMKSICELAVMECYYHNVAKFTEKDASGWWLWKKDKHFWIEYNGKVKLGIDASLVTMEINDNEITITMPPATVQSCTIYESSLSKDSYIVDANSADITAEDEVKAFNEAQTKLEETAAADTSLLSEAQTRAQTLLEDYIKNIGNSVGKEYIINWKYLDSNGKLTSKTETAENKTEESQIEKTTTASTE